MIREKLSVYEFETALKNDSISYYFQIRPDALDSKIAWKNDSISFYFQLWDVLKVRDYILFFQTNANQHKKCT